MNQKINLDKFKNMKNFIFILSILFATNLSSQNKISQSLEPKNFGDFVVLFNSKFKNTKIEIDSVSNNLIYFSFDKRNLKSENFIEIGIFIQKSKESEYQPFIKINQNPFLTNSSL